MSKVFQDLILSNLKTSRIRKDKFEELFCCFIGKAVDLYTITDFEY